MLTKPRAGLTRQSACRPLADSGSNPLRQTSSTSSATTSRGVRYSQGVDSLHPAQRLHALLVGVVQRPVPVDTPQHVLQPAPPAHLGVLSLPGELLTLLHPPRDLPDVGGGGIADRVE